MEKLVKLMPHNFEAYTKVKEQFKVSDRACVVHATGTGKSYIIAATAEDYDKVLILAPNDYVLSKLDKVVGMNCKLMTYDSLIYRKDIKGFDLIVFDEFPKISIPKWLRVDIGDYVKKLLKINPGAKMLGTTSTEIPTFRRNLVEKIFDGNIVSRLTLPMAWSQRILRVPTYITGLYTFDNIDWYLKEEITNSSKSEEEKRLSLRKLDSFRLDWVNNFNVGILIKRHIDPDSKKIIVFCDKIQHVSEVKKNVESWLTDAGLKIHRFYSINSQNYYDRSKKDDIINFEKEESSRVKVMFIVNMFNVGIRIKDVDTIIMIRSGRSKVNYFQQIGGCMSSNSLKSPVIFDLADDVDKIDQIVAIQEELNRLEDKRVVETYFENEYNSRVSFDIIDYMTKTHELIEEMGSKFSYKCNSFEKNLIDLKEFVKENNRLPLINNGRDESKLRSFMGYYRSHPEIIEIIRPHKSTSPFDKKLEELKEFVKENNRLPICGKS